MRILAGRTLTDGDLRGPPRVALIDESFAGKHYPERDAVGRFPSVHAEPYRPFGVGQGSATDPGAGSKRS